MGIGLVLVGYLFCLNLFNVYTLLPASVLMYLGLSKLSRFNRPLRVAKYLTFPTGAAGAAGCVLLLVRTFFPGLSPDAAETASHLISLFGDLSLAALLFSVLGGMSLLCAEVGLPRQRASVISCQVYTLLYYLPVAVLECIEAPEGAAVNRYLALAATVWLFFGLIVFAFTAKCLHDCYRMITMPTEYDTSGGEDGGRTPAGTPPPGEDGKAPDAPPRGGTHESADGNDRRP